MRDIEDLVLEKWDRMSQNEQDSSARQLAGGLPSGFAFRSMRLFRLGDQQHYVAEYEFDGTRFVLIPGGTTVLGYDVDRPWAPTPEELKSWQYSVESLPIDHTLREEIARVTLRPRVVNLRPFLMEATATQPGWEPVSTDDPYLKQFIPEERWRVPEWTIRDINHGYGSVRFRCGDDGTIRAWRYEGHTHAALTSQLMKAGFRFPTSDEWEYACGTGAKTLFRWGDHAPCERYPVQEFPPARDLHRQPNAFGIFIASDPYRRELVSDPHITRAGDGGSTCCGGAGQFLAWLILATAYFDPGVCQRHPDESIWPEFTIARRVLPLS